MRDIFICHAGEDKDNIVRPLVEAFTQAGVSCWYDEAEIQWGDSITKKVNEGLATSKYVVVVFSSAFVNKNWPQRELNAVLNQESSTGEVKVLPLLVGSDEEKTQILRHFPLLNDKRFLPWDGDYLNVVKALLSRLRPEENITYGQISEIAPTLGSRFPLPKIKKQFTQRDKDIFLRNSFVVVKEYFQDALKEISLQYQEIEIDFAEVHNFKFLATIYIRGEVANRCKIWIGGLSSSDSITYLDGKFTIESDNSFNDCLFVTDDKNSLGLKPSGMWFGSTQYDREQTLTAEQGAEYLWKKFTNNL